MREPERLLAALDNAGRARRAWRQGRTEGYPLCCIAHFCWDSLTGCPSAVARADQIGLELEGEWPFVPCGVIHAADSNLSLPARLHRILAFQWFLLIPGSGGRAFRRLTGLGITTARNEIWTPGQLDSSYREQIQQEFWFYDGGLDSELEWS
jgi:hypothetical protein